MSMKADPLPLLSATMDRTEMLHCYKPSLMKVLLTGANGYIGKRLLPLLVKEGHEVVCSVRDRDRFHIPPTLRGKVQVVEVDLLQPGTYANIPKDIQGAYYLVHSMSASKDFADMELAAAKYFTQAMADFSLQHLIYLTGIVNESELSEHLASRKAVEEQLAQGPYHFTALRAGIIIGSGSASFEIIRDLVEKLPVLITPKWVKTKCQPIGIRDVLSFLSRSLFDERLYDQSFDIYGPDVLSYGDMMMTFAKVRGLRRWIVTVPVMTPKLSSYWLYFVTSTTYNLATALVSSMKVNVIAKENNLANMLGIQPMSYEDTLLAAFDKIEQNAIVSSWKDSFVSGVTAFDIDEFISVPTYGCFVDKRSTTYTDRTQSIHRIWSIGGQTGWYYANWLWKIRGYLDKLVGGVGLRRGRTHADNIRVGDAVDFWRVIYADKAEGRLLLYAEMLLPGDAWLEFSVDGDQLKQTATFRPIGLWGRLYWYLVLPFHGLIFSGMLRKLAQ